MSGSRCDSTFSDSGSTYLCLKDSGHGGVHEHGDWEWWDEAANKPMTHEKGDMLERLREALTNRMKAAAHNRSVQERNGDTHSAQYWAGAYDAYQRASLRGVARGDETGLTGDKLKEIAMRHYKPLNPKISEDQSSWAVVLFDWDAIARALSQAAPATSTSTNECYCSPAGICLPCFTCEGEQGLPATKAVYICAACAGRETK